MSLKINHKNLIFLILFITPFIDVINGVSRVLDITNIFSFGQVIRMMLLTIMLLYFLVAERNILIRLFLILGGIIAKNIIYLLWYSADFFENISADLRYFFVLTFWFLISSSYQKKLIGQKDIEYWMKGFVLLIAAITVISNILGFGIDYAGTKRLFTEVNALTAILVCGVSIWLYELFSKEIELKNIILLLFILYITYSQATKTGLIGIVVCFAYFLYYSGVVKRQYTKQILFAAGGLAGAVVIYRYFTMGNGINILARWQYFYNNMDVLSFLLSGRDTLLETSMEVWKSKIIFMLFGTSYSLAREMILHLNPMANYMGAEMEFFDLLLYYGVFVTLAVYIPIFKVFINSFKYVFGRSGRNYYSFPFLIITIVSFLGGHVLSSPMAGPFFCCTFVLAIIPQQEEKLKPTMAMLMEQR